MLELKDLYFIYKQNICKIRIKVLSNDQTVTVYTYYGSYS